MHHPMSLADESQCVRTLVRLPGLFGRPTPGEFVSRYGVPSEVQSARLLKFLYVENGRLLPRSRVA